MSAHVEPERVNGCFLLKCELVLGSLGKIRNPDLREKLVYYGFYDTKRGSVVHGGVTILNTLELRGKERN